jgi:hypothetical protein
MVVEHLGPVEQLLGKPQRTAGIARQEHALGDVGVWAQMYGSRHAHSH